MNLKSRFFIFILILFVLFSVASVSAQDNQTQMLSDDSYHSISELNKTISESKGVLNLEHDYKYEGNYSVSIEVNKMRISR